jgi:hypothetical protein
VRSHPGMETPGDACSHLVFRQHMLVHRAAGVLTVRSPGSPDSVVVPADLPRLARSQRWLGTPGRLFPGCGRRVSENELPAAAAGGGGRLRRASVRGPVGPTRPRRIVLRGTSSPDTWEHLRRRRDHRRDAVPDHGRAPVEAERGPGGRGLPGLMDGGLADVVAYDRRSARRPVGADQARADCVARQRHRLTRGSTSVASGSPFVR